MDFLKTNLKCLLQVQDEFGQISIEENDKHRFLIFGEGVEQSCVRVNDWLWLEYEYTRAMLLAAMAHPQPKSALFLGLGSGALTQACMAALSSLEQIEVIELRPLVVELAQQYFGFSTQDERLSIRCGDALTLLPEVEPVDLIFLDLYGETGPSSAHLSWGYLEACRAKLKPDGWLIINQWALADGKPLGAVLLRGLFRRHYWEFWVKEGNVILLVPAANSQQLPKQQLRQGAQYLANSFGYELTELLASVRSASP